MGNLHVSPSHEAAPIALVRQEERGWPIARSQASLYHMLTIVHQFGEYGQKCTNTVGLYIYISYIPE